MPGIVSSSLNHSCLVDLSTIHLIKVTLAVQDADSKLVKVVADVDVDSLATS